MAHWPTRKYKKYRSFLTWLRRVEAGVFDTDKDDEDGDEPRWWVERGDDVPWEGDSFQRSM